MQSKRLTLDEALKIGNAASQHARSIIKKGSTQIENNALEAEYITALQTGVGTHKQFGGGIRRLQDDIEGNSLEKSAKVNKYENIIRISTKYSLGNCYEMALMALDYVLNHCPDVHAHVYSIDGGDHIFLVINRKEPCMSYDVSTWGDDAVICDPWSNNVYPAKDYLQRLKNYVYVNNKNCVEDFDPKRHDLKANKKWNTTYLREHRSVDELRKYAYDDIAHLKDILRAYLEDLMKIYEELENSPSKEKIKIIANKINTVNACLLQIKATGKKITTNETDYRKGKMDLTNQVRGLFNVAVNAMQFSERETKVLLDLQTHKKFGRLFTRKTEEPSEVTKKLQEASEKANTGLQKK